MRSSSIERKWAACRDYGDLGRPLAQFARDDRARVRVTARTCGALERRPRRWRKQCRVCASGCRCRRLRRWRRALRRRPLLRRRRECGLFIGACEYCKQHARFLRVELHDRTQHHMDADFAVYVMRSRSSPTFGRCWRRRDESSRVRALRLSPPLSQPG